MFAVIFSEKDIASLTIKDVLLNNGYLNEKYSTIDGNTAYFYKNSIFLTIKKDLIYADYLDDLLRDEDVSLYIFASRHKSESEKPALLTHSTGNWTNEATFGGSPEELAYAPSVALTYTLRRLYYHAEVLSLQDKFLISREVTHHGPTNLSKPLLFVELGSSPANWTNRDGATAVALTIIDLIENYEELLKSGNFVSAIGFGGSHYCPSFNNIILRSKYALGHIAPKYAFDANMSLHMIEKAYIKTIPTPQYVIIDWKGLKGEQRQEVVAKARELNLDVKKTKEISKEIKD